VVVTIGLMGLLLAEMAALFSQGTRYAYNSNTQSDNMWIARTALDMTCGEFRQALVLRRPMTTEPTADLVFVRPTADGQSTDMNVRYYVSSHRLMRKTWLGRVEPPDEVVPPRTLLIGVVSLQVSAVPGDVLAVLVRVTADTDAAGAEPGPLAGVLSGMATARASE
jgi:hypothetical protein